MQSRNPIWAFAELRRYGDPSCIPQPTQERRKELIKTVGKQKTEGAKVALRNIRRDANEAIKKLEKDKEINEDESKRGQDSVQKLVDKFVKQMGRCVRRRKKRSWRSIDQPVWRARGMRLDRKLEEDGIFYRMMDTRSPRDFFAG